MRDGTRIPLGNRVKALKCCEAILERIDELRFYAEKFQCGVFKGGKTILNDGTIGFDPVDINFFGSYPVLLNLKTGNFAVSWEIESELHGVELAERYGDNHQVRRALKAICLRLDDFLARLGKVMTEVSCQSSQTV